jgi:Flp pilus assembly protein TadD
LDPAAEELRKAIELSPRDGPALLSLAQILAQQGKTSESQEVMSRFREARNNRESVRTAQLENDTAIRLVERGELKAGIDHFRTAVGLRPDDSQFHRNLALALYQAGGFAEARREYETAIHLNPQDWQAHCGLGEVLAKQNHLIEGIKEVEEAVQLNPNYAPAFHLLNRLYTQANNPAKAAAASARARSLTAVTN